MSMCQSLSFSRALDEDGSATAAAEEFDLVLSARANATSDSRSNVSRTLLSCSGDRDCAGHGPAASTAILRMMKPRAAILTVFRIGSGPLTRLQADRIQCFRSGMNCNRDDDARQDQSQ